MPKIKLGIIGTGFIAKGLAGVVRRSSDFEVSAVLTRREAAGLDGFHDKELTCSIDELLGRCEIVVECSGDTLHATTVIDRALKARLPVVTMNSEWHVTVGSYFRNKGLVTEAEGDQGGCLAALHEEALVMGFRPLAYINVKGFLNHTPTRQEMEYYAGKQGISLDQVTSFTDGTKVQIEQAHVANGLGCAIARTGLLGPAVESVKESVPILAAAAEKLDSPIADYILTKDAPGAVFIVARHDEEQVGALNYMKMGEGPYYVIKKPYHLCHLEMIKTLRRVVSDNTALLDNGDVPTVSVAAIAKRELLPGSKITRGVGSFDVRGECLRITENEGHLPIGLVQHAVLKRRVAPGDVLSMDDVELPDSLALSAWRSIERRVMEQSTLSPDTVPAAALSAAFTPIR